MSIYFLASTDIHPEFAYGEAPSESHDHDFENWLLSAGGAIPLFWLFIFSEGDLVDHPENEDKSGSDPTQVPCSTIEDAARRLRARTPLLNRWLGAKNPVDYHVNLFANWLDSLDYNYITVDWSEFMCEEGIPASYFRDLLHRIDIEDDNVVPELLKISTVTLAHRFITLEEAAQGNFTEEEMRNFFFLLGDGYNHTPPWC